jgi:acetoin utilization deacetylase AcuC-like enzyme
MSVLLVSAGPESEHVAAGHPERPERVASILEHLAQQEDLVGLPRIEPIEMDEAVVELVHTPAHAAAVRAMAERGGGWFDGDTYCAPGSHAAALRSVGAALTAVDAVCDGRSTHAFSISRPPGHHATAGRAMGFCLFNNLAIAVRHAQRRGRERIAIVDIDVHHGNGTEEIFWDDPSVLYASLHQSPLYPGTGTATARGGATAPGLTLNVPLPAGTTGDEWLRGFDGAVLPAVVGFRPDLVLVSAGYDAHAADPLASLDLSAATYAQAAARLRDLCTDLGGGSVWVLEGGYDLGALGESVAATLRGLAPPGGRAATSPPGQVITEPGMSG